MSDDEEGYDAPNSVGAVVPAGSARQQLFSLPQPPPNQGPPSISLAYLIDFAVQRTYQDLTVLTELLPKKSDMERKISIVQFAHSTRQLFIRLLAAVKWAKSAGKVDLCTGITYFLDQQASIFVETADRLFQLSREVLPQARLPAFQIPAAVDVLVLGSYPRLPACVKSRFVPDEPITLKEQACVLRRLNQVIQHRLVFAMAPLPPRMQTFTIRNGMVTFTVPGEFEASLTLLGEDANLPWSLLNIKILAEDYDIGEGTDLVHPFQVHYLHELVEARMLASENPIADLYEVLHSFCVYLQLDILFCQASKFIHDRMIEYVSVDEYVQGNKLVLTYWKSTGKRPLALAAGPTAPFGQQQPSLPGFNYKLVIQVDTNDKKRALRVAHIPSADVRLPTLDDYEATKVGKLNIETLLCDTIVIRIRHRLTQLKQRLGDTMVTNTKITGKVPTLEIPLLEPWIESEKLNVSINLFTGHFVCSVAMLGKTRTLDELERSLNLAQWHKIGEKLRDLKMALLMERCRKTVVGLPVLITDSVPLLPNSTTLRFVAPNRIFLRFSRHESYYLVVEFLPEGLYDCKIRYFLLATTPAAAEKSRDTSGVCEFIKPLKLLGLDANSSGIEEELPNKMRKRDSHLIPDLAAAIVKCDQRIPFILLGEEFERKGIKCQALLEEEGVECEVLNVLGFTKIANPVDKRLVDALWSNSVVSLSGRLVHDRNRIHWTFELITSNIPLIGLHQRHGHASDGDSYARVTVVNTSVSPDGATKCADDLISTMCAFGRFYDLIVRFAPIYKNYMQEFCRVISLSANRMVLSYGPNEKSFFVMLQWKQQDSSFHLSFGSHTSTAPKDGKNASKPESEDGPKPDYGNVAENPHSLMAAFVQTTFNEKRDLAYLMQYLSDTIEPLLALHRLPQWPTLGVGENQNQPIGYGHLFTILPISGTVARVLYKWHVCFEVKMMANGEVALRDCGAQTPATVRQEALKNAAKFMPIVGFKAFFELHERLAGTIVTNVAPLQAPGSVASSQTTGSPSRQRQQQEVPEKASGSPLKTLADSVKTESPAAFAEPSPVGAMIAPSPLSASTPVGNHGAAGAGQQHGPLSQGPMTPSPAPANFAGLLTPSPAPGPASNAGMLMTPSPAPFGIAQSPAPAATQSVSSSESAPAANTSAPPMSPAGPEPSPLSVFKSFAEASAAAGETKGNGGEFSGWEFSNVPAITPVTTAAPVAMDTLPISLPQSTLTPTTMAATAATPTTSDPSPSNTEDWEPSSDPIIVSHPAFRLACSYGSDGRNSLKEFLASVATLEKFSKQLNSLPLNLTSGGPGQSISKVGSLDVKIHLDDKRMTSLTMKVVNNVDGGDMWTDDDLRVMEQYFGEFVAPIQHPHAIAAFIRFLMFSRTVHAGAPKSLVQLMRNQLKHDTTKPWSPSLCLILPPPHLVTPYLTTIGTASVIPGMMAIMVNREQHKMLLWIKLISNIDRKQQWIFPLLYDGESNGLSVFSGPAGATQQQQAILAQYPIIGEVNNILQRFLYSSECSIWTSINGLAEALPHQQQQQIGSDAPKM